MNSKKMVFGLAFGVFLLAMVMQPVMAGVSAEITGIELNGQGDFIEVDPGELIVVEVFFEWITWQIIGPHEEALYEIVVGFEDTPIFCVVDEITNNIDGYDSGNIHNAIKAFEITAPTEPGTYCIYEMITGGDNACEEGKLKYKELYGTNVISSPYPIADFEVVDSGNDEPTPEPTPEPDSDEWELIFGDKTLIPHDRYNDIYWIQFYQLNNQLRMYINTPGVKRVESGSVSMSVTEDIYVQYYTGMVSQGGYGEELDQININPSGKVLEAAFSTLIGLIPYAGYGANIIGLTDAIKETKDEFDVYRINDLRTDFDFTPVEIFTASNIQNLRDNVVIPWDISFWGVNTVRVDFPSMEFPSEGTHNIVFCINCEIFNNDVRHYIALPIKIGKQKIEI